MQFPQIQIWAISKASGWIKLRQIFAYVFNLNFIVCVTCMFEYSYMCVTYAGACRGQKRASEHIEKELQVTV